MTDRRLAAPLLLVVLVVVASCLPGAKAPTVPPTRTLDLAGEGASTTSAKAFGVVFASPKGATSDPSEVTIVFNRPMRPVSLAGEEAESCATIVVAKTGATPKGKPRAPHRASRCG
jgi:hypothetical protein